MAGPIPGVVYTRAPGTNDWLAPGRATLPGPFVPTASTFDVFPNLNSHPGAVWTRSGNTLSSTGRLSYPCYDITDGFVLGTTKPTWSNSGCRIPISQLTVPAMTNHEYVTTADGQVISGLNLTGGRIRVKHKNVTIRDCYITIGYDAARPHIQNNCAIVCDVLNFDTRNLRVEYVTVDPINAGANGTPDDADVSGIYLDSGVVFRCAIRNVTDGVMPDVHPLSGQGEGVPVHVWGNYIQTRWLSYDPLQSDGTHNDGVQIAGGSGHTVIGNTIANPNGGNADPATGSIIQGQCIVIDPYHAPGSTGYTYDKKDAGASANIYIWRNWLSGSLTQISNWLPLTEGGPAAPGCVILENRHGGQCRWPILGTPTTQQTTRVLSGNVADTGGLQWNQVGSQSGTSTIAAGGSVGMTVANHATGGGESHPTTSFAGCDQIVEPSQSCYVAGKGKNAANAWVLSGVWSIQTNSTPAVTLSQATASDGSTWATFVAPQPTTTQTVVLRFTPTGVAATDDVTVTIPPWQN